MTFDFDALPAHYRPEHGRIYAEAVGEAELAFMRAWSDRRDVAIRAVMAWAKEHGAEHACDPRPIGRPEPATRFGFKTRPASRAWNVQRRRSGDKFFIASPSRTPEGQALLAELNALPFFPGEGEIDDQFGIVTDISWVSERGSGSGGVGFPWSHRFAGCGERFFIYFDNPFRELKSLRTDEPGFRITRPENLFDWRLGDGWKLMTKAEIDLAFAEHAVARERAAAAATPELAEAV